MSTIVVRNKLEVRPDNTIQVPGCEPTSSLTSTGLLRSLNCNASIIPLADALALIPGSRIVRTMMPRGQASTGIFFELPAGPPPNGFNCDCNVEDYYKILRDNARVPDQPEQEDQFAKECAGLNFTGCVVEQDIFHMTRDPNMRPNGNPLGGGPTPIGNTPQTNPLDFIDRQGRFGAF